MNSLLLGLTHSSCISDMIYCVFIGEMWICFRLFDLKLTSCVHSSIFCLSFVCIAKASVILDVIWSDICLCISLCVFFCHCIDKGPRYSENTGRTSVRSSVHLKQQCTMRRNWLLYMVVHFFLSQIYLFCMKIVVIPCMTFFCGTNNFNMVCSSYKAIIWHAL